MKLLICGSYASSLWRFRADLLKSLILAGHEVVVAVPCLSSDSKTLTWLQQNQIRAFEIKLERTGINPISDLKSCYQLYRIVKREKVDVFIGYTIKPVIWGVLASWLAFVPKRVALITGLGYAFTGNASGKRAVIQNLAKALYKFSLRKATQVFFQNRDDLRDFRKLGLLKKSTPIKIINGSGVDTDYFSLSEVPSTNFRFLLIARMLGDKGIREFVAAARLIKQTHPNCGFHLVGGLDDNPNALKEDEILQWEADGIVTWHGNVDDVRPFIARSHVYVLPSYREGTPRSVLEAMSMGRAVITTDAPGCRETVNDGDNGFLVPVASIDELANTMMKFISDNSLLTVMGARSRAIAVEKYDVHKVNAEIIKFLGLENS